MKISRLQQASEKFSEAVAEFRKVCDDAAAEVEEETLGRVSDFIRCQRAFSLRAFGNGQRTEGICKHIEKELSEIRANPADVDEWMDVVILAFDGAWRAGHSPKAIEHALGCKLKTNIGRQWPNPISEDEPCEHIAL